jgi:SAM-dependent methyltransferase
VGPLKHRTLTGMRRYWDDRARENAAWYVDTSLAYDDPDMARFFATGEAIVADALDDAPALPARDEVAVEIGSGLGRVCRALAPRFERVIGVDISEEMVRRAHELVPAPNVTFQVGDGASLAGIADASVDLVLSFTVFQHIPDVEVIDGYLAEAGRVLREGGVAVFQWNNEPGHRRWAVRRAVLGLLQRTGVRAERRRRHAPAFLGSKVPLARVDAALARAGLERVGLRNEGTLYAWAWARRV